MMSDGEVSKYLSEIGRRGGKARLQTMTKAQRRASSHKAAAASAKARKALAGKKGKA
jgi:hypothetical protein